MTQTFPPQSAYISADAIPELAERRETLRAEAHALLATKNQQIADKSYEGIPLVVDALSTARRVLGAKETHGEHSPEHTEAYGGLFLDCHRALAEWRRKNEAEYFPLVRHDYDAASGDFLSHGMSIWTMTGDALVPLAEPEEIGRRINERVEEGTAKAVRRIGSLALGQTIKMRTISECTDWAIEKWKHGDDGYGGYVPEIQKLMIRDIIFDNETNDRFEEQIGLSGVYITHDIIQRALALREVNAQDMDKTDLHGTQLFVNDDLIDFVELLDTVASQEWCTEIFMGKPLEEGETKDYSTIRQQAIERQRLLTDQAHMVADFVLTLAESNTDSIEAPRLVEEFMKRIMISIAKDNTELALEMFDVATATGLQEVARLHAAGDQEAALQRLWEVIEAAPGGGYCGAGSCDLVSGGQGTEAEQTLIKSLGFDIENTLIDKGDRRCKKCQAKTVVYDLKKAQKGCLNCQATTKYKS